MSNDRIRNGDMLPLIGGPRDGHLTRVELLFGILPNSFVGFGDDCYQYDAARRAYVFRGPEIVEAPHDPR